MSDYVYRQHGNWLMKKFGVLVNEEVCQMMQPDINWL